MATKAGSCRRLFDGSHGEPLMSAGELMEVAAQPRRLAARSAGCSLDLRGIAWIDAGADTARTPIQWTIDPEQQLMTAVAEGEVRKDEAMAYLDAMSAAKASGYRRLFDGGHAEPLMSSGEIMEVAARMRGLQSEGPSGPLAVVMPANKYAQFARMLGILSVSRRPMRFFASPTAARAWLDGPDVRDWRDGDDQADQ